MNKLLAPGNKKTDRSSGIELLRIFAMMCIVAHHSWYMSPQLHNIYTNVNVGFVRVFYFEFLNVLGQAGVVSFFIISGFFASNKISPLTQICKICKITVFYSVFLFFVSFILESATYQNSTLTTKISAFFPVITNEYWFITTYIIIQAASPFLLSIAKKESRSRFKLFLIMCVSSIAVIMLFVSLFSNSYYSFEMPGRISTCVLFFLAGIYLIHAGYFGVSSYAFSFNYSEILFSKWMFIIPWMIAICVSTVGCIFEWIRQLFARQIHSLKILMRKRWVGYVK